jgi:hypothetical protein
MTSHVSYPFLEGTFPDCPSLAIRISFLEARQ